MRPCFRFAPDGRHAAVEALLSSSIKHIASIRRGPNWAARDRSRPQRTVRAGAAAVRAREGQRVISIARCLRRKLRGIVEADLLELGYLGDGLLETVLTEMLMLALLHLFADGIEFMA
jgi:hypothetical protein